MNMSKCRAGLWFVSLFCFSIAPVGAQPTGSTPPAKGPDSAVKISPATPPSPVSSPTMNMVTAPKKHVEASSESEIQNTSIEGIQISHEPGNKTDEIVVSGYFIFKEKPVSYFYEVKQPEKKIIFEFNDTKAPAAPIPSVAEPPIQKFTVEQHKIDVNKDIRGLIPEFHNQVRVTFFLDNIPDIHVSDQANVILFSYKWTTDPKKVDKYVLKPGSKGWIKYTAGGVVVAGVGAAFALKGKSSGSSEISTSGLPVHKQY